MVTATSATTAVLLAGLAVHGSKLAYNTQHLKGFYTERICGTVFTDRCYEASSRIVCGEVTPYRDGVDVEPDPPRTIAPSWRPTTESWTSRIHGAGAKEIRWERESSLVGSTCSSRSVAPPSSPSSGW